MAYRYVDLPESAPEWLKLARGRGVKCKVGDSPEDLIDEDTIWAHNGAAFLGTVAEWLYAEPIEDTTAVIIPMSEMQSGQTGQIVDSPFNRYIGHFVKVSLFKQHVIDLTNGGNWNDAPQTIMVRLCDIEVREVP